MPHVAKELYTPQTLYTLAGASGAVVAASGSIGYALGFNPRWLGLVFALIIAFAGLSMLPENRGGRPRWSTQILVVAFFNGLLIYAQAVGINTLHQALPPTHGKQAVIVPAIDPVPWWSPAEQRLAAEEMTSAAAMVAAETLRNIVSGASATEAPRDDACPPRDKPTEAEILKCLAKSKSGVVTEGQRQLARAALKLVASYRPRPPLIPF